MEQNLEHWRRSYHIEDDAFESLVGIIATSGAQKISITGDGSGPYQQGVSPRISSHHLNSSFGGTSVAFRAPVIASTTSPLPQLHWDSRPMQDLAMEIDPFVGYVPPAQDPVAVPLADNVVSVPDSSQSFVAASEKSLLRSCVNCWAAKKKCDKGDPCQRCMGPTRTQLPRHLCLRIRLVEEGVFSKWAEPSYKSKLVWSSLEVVFAAKIVLLTHERGGPTLQVRCREFIATSPDQTQLFWKDLTGWKWTYSTAYCLEMPKVDLCQYIDDCASFLLSTAIKSADYLGQIFRMARLHPKENIIRLALRLWAANRLLMKGWEICGHERLGMDIVDQIESPLYGSVPAPRVLQNQLDHLLEQEIVQTERYLLKDLQKVIKSSDRTSWVTIFLATAIILHVMERDAWRLLYWVHHREKINTWRHPLGPPALIEKSVHFSNLLLAHFHYAARGLIPLTLDWDLEENKELVGNNTAIITSMQTLQQHAKNLENQLAVGNKGRDRYQEREESSLDFTLSSLVLVNSVRYADLGDFIYAD